MTEPAPDGTSSSPGWSAGGDIGTVLVTGGSSGLGAAVVAAVKAAGGRPLVLDRQAPAEGVDHEIVDLSDGRAAEEATRAIAERAGGLDAVFTAAGIDRCGTLADVDADQWDLVVKVNLLGTVAVVRAALPYIERSQGRIVTCSSSLGIKAVSDATAYCASKFAVIGFTRALAAELKGRIGVTCLIPSGMTTNFFDDRPEQYKPGPDAKLNRPEDTARSVLFALQQPPGVEVRELIITSLWEDSYP